MFVRNGNILEFNQDAAPILKTVHGKAKIFRIDLDDTLKGPDYPEVGQCVLYCVISEDRYDIHHAYVGYWNRSYVLRTIDPDNKFGLLD